MRRDEGGSVAAAVFALVFVAYAAGAVLSWAAFGATVGPAFFPSAGVTAAALLLTQRRLWPSVIAAVFVAEFLVDLYFGDLPAEAVGYAIANCVEPLAGASLVRYWCGGPPDLRRRKDLVAFIAGSCLAGPLAGGVLGAANLIWLHGGFFPAAVLHWVAGDAIGVFVMAVPILLWSKQFKIIRSRPWEVAGVLVVAAAVSVAAFWEAIPPAMLVLPVLAWAALRLDMVGAALAGMVVAMVANLMTASGRGLFASLDMAPMTRLSLAQLFIAINVLVALLIAQEASARVRAVREREVERRERMRLETLARLAQQLAAALTPRDIGDALIAQVLNESGAKALTLGLLTSDGGRIEWIAWAGYPLTVFDRYGGGVDLDDRIVVTDAVRSGQPVVVRTRDEYAARYSAAKADLLDDCGAQSVVGWPLKSGDSPIGVLFLAWPTAQALDAAQLAYVSAVATMVSQALVRARVYEDEQARAAVLQSAVLPTSPGETPGLDVCVTYEPADLGQGVGGDWYDVMTLPEDRTYFAVGDVVGHGMSAVEDMAQLRTAGRTLAHLGLPPSRLLAELNALTRRTSRGKFATMAVAVYDPAAGSLSYSLAGHPPPLLRRCTGEVVRLWDGRGAVLGPVPETGYTEGTVSITAGDILVMYTDGLVESRAAGIETGISHAQRIIADWNTDAELSGFCKDLQAELVPRPRADDLCVIVVRFGGDGGCCTNC